MSAALFKVKTGLSLDGIDILRGTADPSAGGGVVAEIGSIYLKTDSGTTWHKTGSGNTAWSQLLDTTGESTEDGYQNAFAGKSTTGDEMPTFTADMGPDLVTDTDSLMAATEKINVYCGALPTPEVRTTSPIVDDATINANIAALDAAIGDDADLGTPIATDVDNNVNQNIAALDVALDGKNPVHKAAANQVATAGLAVDSVTVTAKSTVEWLLTLKSNTTGANRRVSKILALNNGSTGVDYNEFSILTVGSAIAGLAVVVDINSGSMRLMVTATENIDYSVERIAS